MQLLMLTSAYDIDFRWSSPLLLASGSNPIRDAADIPASVIPCLSVVPPDAGGHISMGGGLAGQSMDSDWSATLGISGLFNLDVFHVNLSIKRESSSMFAVTRSNRYGY